MIRVQAYDANGRMLCEVDVPTLPATLGRAPGNTIVISDVSVSSRHAQLEMRNGHPMLLDLGSLNGILFNGRAEPEIHISSRTECMIGDVRVVICDQSRGKRDMAVAERTKVAIRAGMARVKRLPKRRFEGAAFVPVATREGAKSAKAPRWKSVLAALSVFWLMALQVLAAHLDSASIDQYVFAGVLASAALAGGLGLVSWFVNGAWKYGTFFRILMLLFTGIFLDLAMMNLIRFNYELSAPRALALWAPGALVALCAAIWIFHEVFRRFSPKARWAVIALLIAGLGLLGYLSSRRQLSLGSGAYREIGSYNGRLMAQLRRFNAKDDGPEKLERMVKGSLQQLRRSEGETIPVSREGENLP